MKVLLLGHDGYLGSYLYDNLKEDTDILTKMNVYSNGRKYDYIINCIASADLEYCEEHKEESDYSNRDVIKDIIKHYPESKIIHFSSYYVYDDEGFCNENSKTTKKYNYCRQKLESEEMVTNSGGVSFRLGKLFGHKNLNKNERDRLTEYIIKNNEFKLDETKFNPTSIIQVLRVIEYELKNGNLYGVYNLSNGGYSTHYKYGCYINSKLNNKKTIKVAPKTKRIFHNYDKCLMDTNKLNKIIKLINWKKDMDYYLKKLKLIYCWI